MNKSYITTKVNQMLKNKNYEKKFSIICINVYFLVNPHNFNKLECLVSGLETKPDITAISETWKKLNLSGQYKNSNGYNFFSNPRLKSKGGCVGMYVKSNLAFSINPELSVINEKKFESLFATMSFKNKSIICGTIYRPPHCDNSSFELLNENLYNILQNLNRTKHKCFILGDFKF